MKLSLVIATYNRAERLSTTLASVVAQTASPAEWECVVVDNNSTDDTADRVVACAMSHPLLAIRCVHETRQGLSWARNRGIAESLGACVAIIDDDERIVPDFVQAYIDFFESHPDAVAAGGPIVADYPGGRPAWISRFTERPVANPMYFGRRVREFPSGRIPGGGNMALRRSAVERYGAFDTGLGRTGTRLLGGEESDLFERLRAGGERLWYVPRAVMYHIIPDEKLTRDYFDRLCLQVGVTQRLRASAAGRLGRARAAELGKWAAALLLALGYLLMLRPSRSVWLLRMRRQITRGVFDEKG